MDDDGISPELARDLESWLAVNSSESPVAGSCRLREACLRFWNHIYNRNISRRREGLIRVCHVLGFPSRPGRLF